MLHPDENGILTVKTEQQYEAVVSGQRDDFSVLVLEVDGISRRTTDRSVVLAERAQREERVAKALMCWLSGPNVRNGWPRH